MYREAPYTGTMIADLIASVAKAEAHAGDPEPMPVRVEVYATPANGFTYDNEQLLGVA